jgi:hypothetical protein
MAMIKIQNSTIDEALHLQNASAIHIGKYQDSPIQGQEHEQASNIRLWRHVYSQASRALDILQQEQEAG